MTGTVTWEQLVFILGGGAAVLTILNGIIVRYFTDRSKAFERMRALLQEANAQWEKHHEVHQAEVRQTTRELHERIDRTNDRVLETERLSRDETQKAIRETETRLGKRLDGFTTRLDSFGKDILAAIKNNGQT